ncbi:hypothetical protein NZD89_12935 [Alicyclobacillus fastidiosus]|uniref:Uncharacterized protein n=1 Tax=Alicyclobacillus fastidiosus TaxID=392011 RepID=A0ABY6ZMY3_9BACL|nr:hypothetical protein [Alicyclobacillus fastidiosus]WAH44202.1 hypothetical protein NZD89_12935 [Alicyclobacillus fastidiosus]GMA60518.1 hypothetical protein GCM10025859_09580 [Alicyclobacillus fastidiosus]
MPSVSVGSDSLYLWYEESEDPLWVTIPNENVLSWWLRESEPSSAPGWFTKAYPALAPYYPTNALGGAIDPVAQYQGYWWP